MDKRRITTVAGVKLPFLPLLLAAAIVSTAAVADEAPSAEMLRDFVLRSAVPSIAGTGSAAAATASAAPRIEVEVGALDPRLHLAPCRRIEPYLPPGTRAWGTLRLGLRCADGDVRWNVYLPVTVKAWVRGLVVTSALPAGSVLQARDLGNGEIDLAREAAPPINDPSLLIGRTLGRALAAGEGVSAGALKPRQWFAAGESVRISAVGAGYAVGGSGEALGPGIEGRAVRIRTESGRIITATPVAERSVEVQL